MTAPPPVPLHDWAAATTDGWLYLNATGVSVNGQGVLIRGASGTGKSTLALELMSRGAALIADDGIWVEASDGTAPFLERPDAATDLVESRGIGLLRAGEVCGRAPLALVIDLDLAESERLPPRRRVTTGVTEIPLVLGAGHATLATAVLHMMMNGREEP